MQPVMESMVVPKPDASAGELSASRSFVLHLWAFVLPLFNMAFLLTGPHPWWVALLFCIPIWLLVMTDNRSKPDLRQPAEDAPHWPFDLQVYLLVAIQLANHVLLGLMASKLSANSWADAGTIFANLLATQSVSGVCAGYSGIVVAHELVHRRNRFQFFLGRLLLMFVCYEHFATEHVRGHHPRIGTREDPATARFGESFHKFYLRTVPAQFRSALHLEQVRLGHERLAFYDPRWLRNRVVQGVLAELAIIAGYFYFFGWLGALFFVLQARMAMTLLEVVNYIEHWGLTRTGKTVTTRDSWDTDNWFTLHTLVGLSRHSDHHARASRPYHLLRRFEESPKMPAGYYGTVVLALFANKRYQALAKAELERKQLGPYAPNAQPADPALARAAG